MALIYLAFIVYCLYFSLLLHTAFPFDRKLEFEAFFVMMFASLGMQQKSNNLVLKSELSTTQLVMFLFVLGLNLIVFIVFPGAFVIEAKRVV